LKAPTKTFRICSVNPRLRTCPYAEKNNAYFPLTVQDVDQTLTCIGNNNIGPARSPYKLRNYFVGVTIMLGNSLNGY